MNALTVKQKNAILDDIILERRTHRRFSEEIPSDDMIIGIINAGLHAPYAGAAVGGEKEYFRRFFVVRKDSETMASLRPLIFNEVLRMASDLDRAVEKNEQLRIQAAGFIARLAAMKKWGLFRAWERPRSISSSPKGRDSHPWSRNPLPIVWKTCG